MIDLVLNDVRIIPPGPPPACSDWLVVGPGDGAVSAILARCTTKTEAETVINIYAIFRRVIADRNALRAVEVALRLRRAAVRYSELGDNPESFTELQCACDAYTATLNARERKRFLK